MSADLSTLIAQQAELLNKMNALLSRNLSKEFNYGEGNVGVTPNFLPCPKREAFATWSLNPGGSLDMDFAASIYPQMWHIAWEVTYNSIVQPYQTQPLLRVQFDNDPKFGRPVTSYHLATVLVTPFSFTANTGNTLYNWDLNIPVRYRYLRLTFGTSNFQGTPPTFSPKVLAGNVTGAAPMLVEVNGE